MPTNPDVNSPDSGNKQNGRLLAWAVLIVLISTLLVSCNNPIEQDRTTGKNELTEGQDDQSMLSQPAYHLAPFRTEPRILFCENPTRVGFRMLDGIFLYNYEEDLMEADFALSKGCFPAGYSISPAMSEDEQSIIINGFNPADGTPSDHCYQYDIKTKKMTRIEGDAADKSTLPYPSEERQIEALRTDTWALEYLRYYPEGSEKAYAPFKIEKVPTTKYEWNKPNQDIPLSPQLTLTNDGRFAFTYSWVSSYTNYGNYEMNGSEYTLNTKDGRYTFVFHKEGDNLIFDAKQSARCTLEDSTDLPDGAVFSVKK